MHDMEELLQRIQKISKLIQVAMNICWVIFGFLILLGFVVAIVPFVTNIDLITFHSEIVSSANLLPIDIIDYIFGDTHLKLQIVLSGLFISMMGGVFVYGILDLKKIFKKITYRAIIVFTFRGAFDPTFRFYFLELLNQFFFTYEL